MTVNLTRIYTKRGDAGDTDLGDMSRVSKLHPRVEAYGTVDELNAVIGLTLIQPDLPLASPSGWRACRTTSSTWGPTCRFPRPPTTPRHAHAPAGGRLLHRLAGGGLRRGQRHAGTAAFLRDTRRHPGGRPPPPRPHRLPARRAAGDLRRGREPRGRPLPEPALGPPVHPRPRRQRPRGRVLRAPLGAGGARRLLPRRHPGAPSPQPVPAARPAARSA